MIKKFLLKISIVLFTSELVSLVFGKQLYSTSSDTFWFGLLLTFAIVIIGVLCKSYFIASIICFIPLTIISVISYFKIKITGLGFTLSDFSLWKKVFNIADLNKENLEMTPDCISLIVFALFGIAIIFLSDRMISPKEHPKYSLVATIAIFVLVFVLVQPFEPQSGSLLGIWTTAVNRKTVRKLDYQVEEVIAQAEEKDTSKYPDKKPNVIVILSESFFDVTELKNVDYYTDPLKAYHALEKESISGKFYTRTVGYGTCSIELEVLTGIGTTYLGQDQYISEWPARKILSATSIPELYKAAGYNTYYVHDFNDSIYKRSEPYSLLGFDKLYFTDNMDELFDGWKSGLSSEEQTKEKYYAWLQKNYLSDMYYSDDLIADSVIKLCETSYEPVFAFATSMENHTPYTADKYSEYTYGFSSSFLSKEGKDSLNALTQGVSDASKMLGELCSYFKKSDEPTVIIFFGDHKPSMPTTEGSTVYDELGLAGPSLAAWGLDEKEFSFTTDYLIWSNDKAYLSKIDNEKGYTSTNFFGLDILDAGNIELTEEWELLRAERNYFDAWTWEYFIDSNGIMYDSEKDCPDEEAKKYLNTLSYYFSDKYN